MKRNVAVFASPRGATHYESIGASGQPTVILIHGVSGPMSVWDRNVEALSAAGYRVIRYDLFGRGFSERLDGADHGLPLYIEQLEALVSGLGVQAPVSIVGSSFGAIVATEYALQHPQQVKGLVLVGPAGVPLQLPAVARLRDMPLLGPVVTRLFGRNAILRQNRKYFADEQPPAGFWDYFQAQLDVPGTEEAMLATLRHAPVQGYVESYRALGQTGIPVGVLWGRQDATFPYAHHATLLDAVPGARLVTVEDAAHLPQYEQADVSNAALLELLAGFEAGGARPEAASPRLRFSPEVNTRLSAEPVANDALFQTPFFQRHPVEPLSLELAPGVVKQYLFPTLYSQVTSSMALFLADYRAASALLPGGLRPMRSLPGKALVAVSSYHYASVRGMAPYNELAISVLLGPSEGYVVSMPVSSAENRMRGQRIWGLPKEVRSIELRQIGSELVTTVQDESGQPAIQLRVPMSGPRKPTAPRITVVSKKGEALVEGEALSEGEGAVRYFQGALRVSGDSADARLIRGLQLSPVPLRTQVATGVQSSFGLPRPHAR